MIETLQSLYTSTKGRGRRIYLRAMTDHVVRDDRLGCPAQLARQYVAGSFAANQQAFCANETKKSALRLAIPGTQVVLNSGGPVMTVIGMTYDGKAVACTWHIDGLAMGDSFPMEYLLRCDVSQAE